MNAGPERSAVPERAARLAFAAMLAAACLWILLLPLFPTQDGPVHLYYARVTSALLTRSPGFEHDFRIARAFPPYALHAYGLMFLLRFFSPEFSEELLACACVLSAGLGFRYFARQIGPSADVVAVLAVPFFLHRFLFLGFYGYSFAIGTAFAAMGLWCRADRGEPLRRLAFLVLCVISLFAHPVAYLVLVAFCWTELLVGRFVQNPDPEPLGTFHAPTRGDLVTLFMASTMVAYVERYSHSGTLWISMSLTDLLANLYRPVDTVRATLVVPLSSNLYGLLTRVAFLATALSAFWWSWKTRRGGQLQRTHLVLGWGILLLLVLPYLPTAINGSSFFAERMAIWSILFVMAAASIAEVMPRVAKMVVVAGAVVFACELALLQSHIGPIARSLEVRSYPANSLRGVRVAALNRSYQPGLMFDPYWFSAVRVVDRGDGLLAEAPWLNLQIMMLEPAPGTGDKAGASALVWNRCIPGQRLPDAAAEAETTPGWRIAQYGCFQVATRRASD